MKVGDVAGAEPASAELTSEQYEELRALIAERFGIDYPPSRRSLLATRVAGRVSARRMTSFAEYCGRLRTAEPTADEWERLAEAITNNETYLFRDCKQFEAAAALLPRLAGPDAPLRVLSAGCSSGEEVYSLALVLASHRGLLPRGFEVHGVDVNAARIAEARAGNYPARSLRPGVEPPRGVSLHRFGTWDEDAWTAGAWLRDRVRFHQRNLVAPGGLGLGAFDLVFCRNVLIYAERARVPRFVRTLCDALRPGGYLVLGSSESLIGANSLLRPVRLGDFFAYVRQDGDPGPDRR